MMRERAVLPSAGIYRMTELQRRDRDESPISLPIIAIACAAVVLAILIRAGDELSIDEPFTASVLQGRWPLSAALAADDVPLFYLTLKIWTLLFGHSDWALRSWSLTLLAASVILCGAAAFRAGGRSASWLAATLMAGSTMGLTHGATARTYALLGCCVSASTYVHLAPSWRTRGLAISHFVGFFAHPIYMFFWGGCCLATVVTRGLNRRRLLTMIAPAVAFALCWGWMIWKTAHLPTIAHMSPPTIGSVQQGIYRLWGTKGYVILAGALVLWVVRRSDGGRLDGSAIRFCVIAGVSAVGAAIVVSLRKPVYASDTTTMLLLPPLAVAVGSVLGTLAPRMGRLAVAAWVIWGVSFYSIQQFRAPDPAPNGAAVAQILARASCGDHIVAAGWAYVTVTYFAARLGAPACVSIDGFPSEIERDLWFDYQAFDARPDQFRAEARRYAASIPVGRRVWVFTDASGHGAGPGTLLDEQLHRVDVVNLHGTSFDVVRVYARN
jgi:hypothetical protein